MSDDQVEIKIGADLVGPIVEKKIQAAIVGALGEPQVVVERLVTAVLNRKVDSNGKYSRSSYDNRFDMIEVLCRDAIRDAVQAAMTQWVEENKPVLLETLKKQITQRPAGFAKMFVDGISESVKTKWTFKVEVKQ